MSNRKILSLRSTCLFFLLILISLIAGISLLPLDAKEPNPDSAIFLYIGQQILHGDILYTDLWDNKGPLLYYINALAVFISDNSMWGLFVIELISLFAAVALGYSAIKKAFGMLPAIFASIIWPLALFFVSDNGGNYTEEYSLPLSFAAIYLFLRSRNSGSRLIYVFFIGVIFSLSILLRPNNAGMEISIALLIFISGIYNRKFGILIKEILAYALGTVAVLAAVLLYFHSINALDDFYDAFIRYNSAYSVVSIRDRVASLMFGLRLIAPSGLPVIAIVSWVVGVFTLISKADRDETQRALISLGVIGLPVEFVLSGTSGLTFTHYYLCWLPVFAILTGYFMFEFMRNLSASNLKVFNRNISSSYIWLIGFIIAMSCMAVVRIPGRVKAFVSTSIHENTVLEAIKDNLDSEEYLLMWGSAAYYNYMTNVKSPTRFFHQLPLFLCAYTTDDMIEEFLDDIKQKKPMIVDTSATEVYLPPIDKDVRKKWKYIDFTERKNENCTMSPKMNEVFDYIYSHYKLVETTDRFKWKIYRYTGGGNG